MQSGGGDYSRVRPAGDNRGAEAPAGTADVVPELEGQRGALRSCSIHGAYCAYGARTWNCVSLDGSHGSAHLLWYFIFLAVFTVCGIVFPIVAATVDVHGYSCRCGENCG
jgi:hypothetical protein